MPALGAYDFQIFAVPDGNVVSEECPEGDLVAAIQDEFFTL